MIFHNSSQKCGAKGESSLIRVSINSPTTGLNMGFLFLEQDLLKYHCKSFSIVYKILCKASLARNLSNEKVVSATLLWVLLRSHWTSKSSFESFEWSHRDLPKSVISS